ncbi:MAG: hypothetical protein Kow0088_21240 [Anaerolineales bacterium]
MITKNPTLEYGDYRDQTGYQWDLSFSLRFLLLLWSLFFHHNPTNEIIFMH